MHIDIKYVNDQVYDYTPAIIILDVPGQGAIKESTEPDENSKILDGLYHFSSEMGYFKNERGHN